MKTVGEMLSEWETASDPETPRSFFKTLELRQELIKEEYNEVVEKLDLVGFELMFLGHLTKETKAELLKELCDLVYVVVGTAVKLELPFDEGFARVHQNNMSKLVDGKIVRAENGKVLKPEGYVKVDLKDIV